MTVLLALPVFLTMVLASMAQVILPTLKIILPKRTDYLQAIALLSEALIQKVASRWEILVEELGFQQMIRPDYPKWTFHKSSQESPME